MTPHVQRLLALISCLPLLHMPLHAQAAPRALTATESLRIDGEQNLLTDISSVTMLKSGGVAVSQAKEHLIRFFDATGKAAGRFGSAGEGPGEFKSLGVQGLLGDTLWVVDRSLERITFISLDGKLIRSIPYPTHIKVIPASAAPGAPQSMLGTLAIAPGGIIVGRAYFPTDVGVPSWYQKGQNGGALIRASLDGTFQRAIGWEAGVESCRLVFKREAGSSASAAIPFCATPLTGIGQNGARLVRVLQENATGTTGTFRVIAINASGDTSFTLNHSYTAQPIPPARIAKAIAGLKQVMQMASRGAGPRAEDIAAVEAVRTPKNFPGARAMAVGTDGTIWIDTDYEGSVHHWLMIAPNGRVTGTVALPGSAVILNGAGSSIWGTDTDTDGVVSVVRWQIRGM